MENATRARETRWVDVSGRIYYVLNNLHKNMKTLELNEQALDWLIEHLRQELDENNPITYSETSKGIMQHLLEKLTKE